MARKPRSPEYFTRILPPGEQATGSFDAGAITEQKMIGFAGEGSAIHRIGPLYYWAWAEAQRKAAVEPHPHRGFEIMSYVIAGAIEHIDSLGNRSQIGAGGVQLMQTGSGIEHEEIFVGTPASSLQIWLDPHFRRQIEVAPRYEAFTVDQFPRLGAAKIVIGAGSPLTLVTPDVRMQDVSLKAGESWQDTAGAGTGWAAIVLEGEGTLQGLAVRARDFFVQQSEAQSLLQVSAKSALHLIFIAVPLVPPYPLFPKPR